MCLNINNYNTKVIKLSDLRIICNIIHNHKFGYKIINLLFKLRNYQTHHF